VIPTLEEMKSWQPYNFFVRHLVASKISVYLLVKDSYYANFPQGQRRSGWEHLEYRNFQSFVIYNISASMCHL
jgi:hypothetical protein